MNTTSQTLWKRRECASADVDGSLVLLDLESLRYHSLNATASAAWRALECPATLPSVAEALEQQFEVDPAQCRASVARLLQTLEASGLVRQVSSGEAVR